MSKEKKNRRKCLEIDKAKGWKKGTSNILYKCLVKYLGVKPIKK
jgi:hypothetical protein